MKVYKFLLESLLVFGLFFSGCSGGGGSGGSDSSTPLEDTKTGVFLDSAVEGVKYKTSSGLEGYTNAKGEYQFKDGDSVEFLVGNISLGNIKAKDLVSVLELDNPKESALILQSLDSDGNPNNGINITPETFKLFENSTIDIKSVSINNNEFTAKYKSLTNKEFTISDKDAIAHAEYSMMLDNLELLAPNLHAYYIGHNNIYDARDMNGPKINKDKLQAYSNRRLQLYYYNYFIYPELSLNIAYKYNELSNQEKAYEATKEFLTNVTMVTGEIVALVDENPVDFKEHAAKRTVEYVRGVAIDQSLSDTKNRFAANQSLFNASQIAVSRAAVLFDSCKDLYEPKLSPEDKATSLASCATSLISDGANIFNDSYMAYNFYTTAKHANTILLVKAYLDEFFNAGANINFMYKRYSVTTKEAFIQKLKENVLTSSTVFWSAEGTYSVDDPLFEELTSKYITQALEKVSIMKNTYGLKSNLDALDTSVVVPEITKSKYDLTNDKFTVCYQVSNVSYFDVQDINLNIKIKDENLLLSTKTIQLKDMYRPEITDEQCIEFAHHSPLDISEGKFVTLVSDIEYNIKEKKYTFTSSQDLYFTQSNLFDLIQKIAPPTIKIYLPTTRVKDVDIFFASAKESYVDVSQGTLSFEWTQINSDDYKLIMPSNSDSNISITVPTLPEGISQKSVWIQLKTTASISKKETLKTFELIVDSEQEALVELPKANAGNDITIEKNKTVTFIGENTNANFDGTTQWAWLNEKNELVSSEQRFEQLFETAGIYTYTLNVNKEPLYDAISSDTIRITVVNPNILLTYKWETSEWSQCIGECGTGNAIQTRTSTCKTSTDTTVEDSTCTETKPLLTQSCNYPCEELLPTIILSEVTSMYQNEKFIFQANLSENLDSKYSLKISLGDGGGGYLDPITMSPTTTSFTYSAIIGMPGDRIFKVAIYEGDTEVGSPISGNYVVKIIENEAPIANAGNDITITENDFLTLDASLSTDDDEIVSYNWKLDSILLSEEMVFSLNPLNIGVHNIILTVVDNKGLSHTDSINITVKEEFKAYKHTIIDDGSDGVNDRIITSMYSPDGKLIRKTSGMYGLDTSEIIEEHIYHVNGHILSETFSYSNYCSIYDSCVKAYTYNSTAQLTKVLETDRKDSSKSTITEQYTYDNDNLIESIKVDRYKNFNKELFSYNNDILISKYSYTKYATESVYSLNYRLVKEYQDGDLIVDLYTSYYNTPDNHTSQIEIHYTNSVVTRIIYNDDFEQESHREELYDLDNIHISSYGVNKTNFSKVLQLNRGNLKERTSTDRDTQVVTQSDYTYNSNGNVLTEVTYYETTNRTKHYEYTDDYKLLHSTDIIYNSGTDTYSKNYSLTRQYNEYGSIISQIAQDTINPSYNYNYEYRRTYVDDKQSSFALLKDNLELYSHTYFPNGQIEYSNYQTSYNKWYFQSTDYEYTKREYVIINNKHLLSQVIGSKDNGQTYTIGVYYTYNSNGSITQEKMVDEGVIYYQVDREYETNELSKVIYYDHNIGKQTSTYSSSNELNPLNIKEAVPNTEYVTLMVTHNNLTNKDELIQKYAYDELDRLITIRSFEPPYTRSTLTAQIKYNEDNQIIEKESWENGNRIKTLTLYNQDGSIHQENILKYQWDSSILEDVYTYSYTIANQTKTATIHVNIADGTNYTLVKKFNLSNHLLYIDNQGDYAADFEYLYNTAGFLTKVNWKYTGQDDIATEIYNYNSSNVLQKVLYINWSGTHPNYNYNSVDYTYTNNLISRTEYDKDNDGSIESTVDYYYVR